MRARKASTVSLRQQIEQEIRQHGPIPFSRYMRLCLFDPVHGYYASHAGQFGKAGDFYTSSDIHAVFGRLLARQFDEIWRALDRPPRIEILELGPGRGLFARDVLDWSRKKFPDFFAAITYTLQESSPALRAKLPETLREHVDTQKVNIPAAVSEDQPKRRLAAATPLIVFANEFFDALPVEILSPAGKLHITLESSRLHEVWLPPLADELEFLDRYGVLPEANERIEVPVVAREWANRIAAVIARGVLLVIDYGYTRREQVAGRHRGTLMAYRQHSVTSDPYQAPGEQDLTAHVNFSALASACELAGMRCEKLRTQAQFLMGIGEINQFADAFEDCRIPQERAKVALQLKHLVTPDGMGEEFQVLMASRDVDPAQIATLSGLSFGGGS
jgi:SAM-dependent MidA family methyltransferase